MSRRGKELPKIADAEKESMYGYVHGVSGPGETYECLLLERNIKLLTLFQFAACSNKRGYVSIIISPIGQF